MADNAPRKQHLLAKASKGDHVCSLSRLLVGRRAAQQKQKQNNKHKTNNKHKNKHNKQKTTSRGGRGHSAQANMVFTRLLGATAQAGMVLSRLLASRLLVGAPRNKKNKNIKRKTKTTKGPQGRCASKHGAQASMVATAPSPLHSAIAFPSPSPLPHALTGQQET